MILEALLQMSEMLALIAGAIALLEGVLFWVFTGARRRHHLGVSVLLGLLLGGIYLLWQPADQPLGMVEMVSSPLLGVMFVVLTTKLFHRVQRKWVFPILMLAPALVCMAIVVVYPFLYELKLSFVNLNMYSMHRYITGGDLKFVGLENFIKVFTTSPLQSVTFFELLGRTLLWTVINLIFHVSIGLGLALLLSRKIKGRGIYRTFLIVPWAMPAVVAILIWRGEFHPQFGFVNMILSLFQIPAQSWWSDPFAVFLSCIVVNVWLGVPFMMIVFLGGLQNISPSYYEAAAIDGASKWTQFKEITLPLLKPTVVPSVTLGTIWTFNNVNVIYLMTGQNGGTEAADILISALFKSAFTYNRYSYSAAFAVVIFLILLVLAAGWLKISKGSQDAA